MRGKVLLMILIVSLFLWEGIGLAFQNEPDGFRGLKWGDRPTEDMVYCATVEGERIYLLPNDKMHIDNARFYKILYSFYGSPERFSGVGLFFKGDNNFSLLKTLCRGRFGEETLERFYELSWHGQTTVVLLTYDPRDEEGYLALNSKIIFTEYRRNKEKKEIERAEEDR